MRHPHIVTGHSAHELELLAGSFLNSKAEPRNRCLLASDVLDALLELLAKPLTLNPETLSPKRSTLFLSAEALSCALRKSCLYGIQGLPRHPNAHQLWNIP